MAPLSGIKVIELGGIGPVPFAGGLFRDLGAEVVRVEQVGGTAALPADVVSARRSGIGRVGIDLKTREGVALAAKLIESVDVVLEGFRPGVAERLGVGPESSTEANPALIYARMTGWGQAGPLASEAGHDINYVGLVGALAATGRSGDRPVPALNLVADYGGGALYLVVGVRAALHARDRTGRGDVIDVAMVDGVASLMGPTFDLLSRGWWVDQREANLLDGGAPFYTTYETADGRFVAVGALEPAFYDALVRGLGLDPDRLPDRYDRSDWPRLREIFAERFATADRDEWATHFARRDACVTPVLTLEEVASHPHHTARGTFEVVDGRVIPAPAPRFATSALGARAAVAAPSSAEILEAAGLPRQRIDAALAAGIVE